MDRSFWQSRWSAGRIGFHRAEVNKHLMRFSDELGEAGPGLVPLCGKSHDLTYLAQKGYEVVGCEFIEDAAHSYFSDLGITAERKGPTELSGGGVRILVRDFFELTRDIVGPLSWAWDRAALIAVPDTRGYAKKLLSLMQPGAVILTVTVEYDDSKLDGPPFSVSSADIEEMFGGSGDIERLFHEEDTDMPLRFKEMGLTAAESVWRIRVSGS